MLRAVTKKELWEAEDEGLDEIAKSRMRYSLKAMQDTMALKWLKDCEAKTIGEIGGGDSRVLAFLSQKNTCSNIDPFEGADNGPTQAPQIEGVRNVHAAVGAYSDELKENEFDVTFSISVVEHVVTKDLKDFFEDCARITKPGGLTLHLVDTYIGDTPEANFYADERVREYAAQVGRHFDFSDPSEVISEITFRSHYASNPDNIMRSWNKIGPKMVRVREERQSCSLIVAGTRKR